MDVRFKFVSLLLNNLIDDGAEEKVQDVLEKMENGTLIDYLAEKYNSGDLRDFANKSEAIEYLKGFAATYSENDLRRKFLVKNNGLNAIVAAFMFS